MKTKREDVRNIAIIAHVDHGKTTLVDELLKQSGVFRENQEVAERVMDSNDIERERGITIKLNAVNLKYNYQGEEYILHLIDTPGHVDFSYEVSRSLAACEGAILVVDAAQGIEAQTLANLYLALDNNLTIIPVINKIDLPNADPEKVKRELIETLGFNEDEIVLTSAKNGIGIEELIETIIKKVPAPKGDKNKDLQALIFDSYFDAYRGIMTLVRVVNGKIKVKDKIKMLATGAEYEVVEIGIHTPHEMKKDQLVAGEVGYLCASIKSIEDVKVGDTITLANSKVDQLPGYQPMKPMVFCGLYPVEPNKYEELKDALMKLRLNDAALIFEPETSQALGFGFRTGFLGLLHMDVIQERIEREFKIDLIATAPSVEYHVELTNGNEISIDNPSAMPDFTTIKKILEPYVEATIMVPTEYIGPIMELCQNKRGTFVDMKYIEQTRASIRYDIPLSEIVYDFFDKLKSYTKGYASFDYEIIGYKSSNLVKMDILLNGEIVDALSVIVHKDFAYNRGKAIVNNLKKLIPRQQFEVPIQAAVNSKIIARENVAALRKDVLAKCYGGDISRKKKLLEKQKEGKKRMKQVGSVEIPQEAFLAVLQLDDEK